MRKRKRKRKRIAIEIRRINKHTQQSTIEAVVSFYILCTWIYMDGQVLCAPCVHWMLAGCQSYMSYITPAFWGD